LDTWEDMTDLGAHLINMPIDLNLAKMILFSISMKCLDPILVIACFLSYEEPVYNSIDKTNILVAREKLDNQAYSDHIVLYKIYKVTFCE
jgi:HrpA-like RNA helicase